MTTSESYLKDLAETLYKFQQKNVLCDTVLIADDYHVWAHSIILAAASPYVYTRFLMITGHKAKYRFSLKLAGCEAACVKAVLHFLYTGSLVLSANFQQPEVFAGILQVCVKLGINVTKLNGAAVKFVDSDPYAVSIESNENDLKLSEESVQGTSLDSSLEEDKQHDSMPFRQSSESDSSSGNKMFSVLEEQLFIEEENIQPKYGDSADVKLDMDVFEPPCSPSGENANSLEIEDSIVSSEMSSHVTPQLDNNGNTVRKSLVRIEESDVKRSNDKQNDELGHAVISAVPQGASVQTVRNRAGKRSRRIKTATEKIRNSDILESLTLPSSDNSIQIRVDDTKWDDVTCKVCGKRFGCNSDLKKHVKEYRSHSQLTCNVCGKVLSGKRQLQVHEKFHARNHLHMCQTCGKVYRYRSGLVIHSYEHTGQLPYLCDVCGAGFKDFFSMGQHKKRRHSTFRPFVCQTCGKGFIRNVLLLRHVRSHSGEKQHICQVCGMAFGYSANLTRHIRNHAGEKPHSCDVCGKSFNRLDHLQGHALTHKGEQSHTCLECKKVFKSAILLRRHEAIHSDDNLHTCNVCGKRFTALIRLKQHMITHQEKQYKCHICTRTFSFDHFLLKHVKKCHCETISI